jgi:alpha-tubulin suppressor-like RCC1 family protein
LIFQAISMGGTHACALTPAGEAYCWGHGMNWLKGQLGDGTQQSHTSPNPVVGNLRFRSITSGSEHTCGVTLQGVGYCWGSNRLGQLGIGSRDSSLVPVQILGQP